MRANDRKRARYRRRARARDAASQRAAAAQAFEAFARAASADPDDDGRFTLLQPGRWERR